MKIRKLLIIIMSAISLLVLGAVSYTSYNLGVNYGEKNAEEIRKSRIINSLIHKKVIKQVPVIKIKNSNIGPEISSSGRVVSLRNITIKSQVSGKIEGNFSIKKGASFRKGDILFRVRDTDIRRLTEAQKSNFINLVSSNLADIKLDFPKQYNKWNIFFNSLSLNSNIIDLPETPTTKEKNFISSRRIMEGYLSVKSDEEKLNKYTVRATFDGIIVESYTDIGANINMNSPVIDVISSGNMEVELNVSSKEFNFIKIGNNVVLTDGSKKFNGVIVRKLDGFINENTQSMSVFVSISYFADLLNNKMIDATIYSSVIDDVCKIPTRALFANNKIFIVNSENKLEIKSVNIISNQDNNVLVDNLSNNTMVVSEPLINAKEGVIVKPKLK